MKNVLIVDDDQPIRSFLAAVLDRAGFAVCQASSGAEGLCAAAAMDFDLVVSDVEMPKMSGPEMVRRILEKSPETRVLLITGGAQRLQHHPLMLKPIRPGDLVAAVARALRPASSR